MSKRILIIIVALAVVIGGGIAVLALTPSTPEAAPPTTSNPSAEATPEASADAPEESAALSAGAYVDYSDAALAAAEGTRLLFFHAPWCPQCRAMEEDIVASGVPDGVTILKVDYDSNQALRQQYGVTLQTTFVELDAAGAPVQNFVAYDDPSLSAVVAAML